jgi:hypothetical protein
MEVNQVTIVITKVETIEATAPHVPTSNDDVSGDAV